ncbi:hypothetical protein C8F04DRAFT_1403582 [Mycena alexandri]|uniref:Uncharacterized protein n=1 Tax=Mycena alexandri TaxID=1745969 RepID=A0AAD6WPJ6_9AGAR|nr:hypothetical protein C8F04DRAFT_1403582 [Mycena alexandri]
MILDWRQTRCTTARREKMSSPLFSLSCASPAPNSAQCSHDNGCPAGILVRLPHDPLHANVGRETVRSARGCRTQDGVGSEGARAVSGRRDEQDTDEVLLIPPPLVLPFPSLSSLSFACDVFPASVCLVRVRPQDDFIFPMSFPLLLSAQLRPRTFPLIHRQVVVALPPSSTTSPSTMHHTNTSIPSRSTPCAGRKDDVKDTRGGGYKVCTRTSASCIVRSFSALFPSSSPSPSSPSRMRVWVLRGNAEPNSFAPRRGHGRRQRAVGAGLSFLAAPPLFLSAGSKAAD